MRVGLRTLALVGIVSCVWLTSACSSSPSYVPIPVEDARALNSHVSTFFVGTLDLLESSTQQVSVVGTIPSGIRTQDFELELAKSVLMGCFNDPVEITEVTVEAPRGVEAVVGSDSSRPLTARPDLGNVQACDPNELISLESYVEYAPDRISEFLIDRLLLVDSLRVNLKHVLQERLNLLEEHVLDSRGEVARLRETSRERFENTMASDEVTEDQRLETQADYEVIQQELDDVEQLLEEISGELSELRRFRRQLVEDVAVQVAAMGTPSS